MREQLIRFYLGRAFLAEATAYAKALRLAGDWLVLRNREEAGHGKQPSELEGLVPPPPPKALLTIKEPGFCPQ